MRNETRGPRSGGHRSARGRRTPPTDSWGVRRPRGGQDPRPIRPGMGPGRRQAPRRPHDAGRPARGGRPLLGDGGPSRDGPWRPRRGVASAPRLCMPASAVCWIPPASANHALFVDATHLNGQGANTLSTDLAALLDRDRAASAPGPRWVDLPAYRPRPVIVPFEDVEQSRGSSRSPRGPSPSHAERVGEVEPPILGPGTRRVRSSQPWTEKPLDTRGFGIPRPRNPRVACSRDLEDG